MTEKLMFWGTGGRVFPNRLTFCTKRGAERKARSTSIRTLSKMVEIYDIRTVAHNSGTREED